VRLFAPWFPPWVERLGACAIFSSKNPHKNKKPASQVHPGERVAEIRFSVWLDYSDRTPAPVAGRTTTQRTEIGVGRAIHHGGRIASLCRDINGRIRRGYSGRNTAVRVRNCTWGGPPRFEIFRREQCGICRVVRIADLL
ncbi:MAG: hypothetical protein ACRD5R_15145, partial [Candidatus Acidiferrales bacterium]